MSTVTEFFLNFKTKVKALKTKSIQLHIYLTYSFQKRHSIFLRVNTSPYPCPPFSFSSCMFSGFFLFSKTREMAAIISRSQEGKR